MVEKTCQLCNLCSRLTKHALKISSSSNSGSNVSKSAVFRRLNSAPLGMGEPPSSPGFSGNSMESAPKNSCSGRSPFRPRSSLENYDYSSQDSGYSQEESSIVFRFPEPNALAPRKSKLEPSPLKLLVSPTHTKQRSSSSIAGCSPIDNKFSFFSNESFDDGFLEVGDLDKSFPDENAENIAAPAGLQNLLTAQLITGTPEATTTTTISPRIDGRLSIRQPLRRSFSCVDSYSSPASSKIRVGLFKDHDISSPTDECSPLEKAFKRPRDLEANAAKRRKSNSLRVISENSPREPTTNRFKLQRSISETAATNLASVLNSSYATTDLIADYTRPYALPYVSGRHEDIKSITPETLAGLINGEFNDCISSFKIIDCRYPYEYDGGHIKGSINLYTKEQIEKELVKSENAPQPSSSGRNILIFHCEFSVERGPSMYRFLRYRDRDTNNSNYPSLHYPEVYLLHGGYQNFFTSHKLHCEPCFYQPMVDPKHVSDLKKFRVKSNSWSGDAKRSKHSSLKRLM